MAPETGILENAGVLALLGALPTLAVAWFAYRRAVRSDTVVAQAGISTFQSGTIQQVIDGLNSVIENLRQDNNELRQRVDECADELTEIKRLVRMKEEP